MKEHANREVQELTLNLLKIFIAFCEENHLRYYVGGGALIGVMRHKGFIPWDDDIDISMPRKDYDRFLELIAEKMPDNCGIINRYTDPKWHFAMSQFIDLESEIVIELAEEPRKSCIWVDVFPLDGLPNNSVERWFHIKYILIHRYLVQIAHIQTQADNKRKRPFYEKMILNFCKAVPVGKLLHSDRIIDHMEKILRKWDFDHSIYAGNMLGRYREREVVLQRYFGSPKKSQFESIMVNVPEHSHEYLTAVYGDYMKLPPESERMAHNVTVLKNRNR